MDDTGFREFWAVWRACTKAGQEAVEALLETEPETCERAFTFLGCTDEWSELRATLNAGKEVGVSYRSRTRNIFLNLVAQPIERFAERGRSHFAELCRLELN